MKNRNKIVRIFVFVVCLTVFVLSGCLRQLSTITIKNCTNYDFYEVTLVRPVYDEILAYIGELPSKGTYIYKQTREGSIRLRFNVKDSDNVIELPVESCAFLCMSGTIFKVKYHNGNFISNKKFD